MFIKIVENTSDFTSLFEGYKKIFDHYRELVEGKLSEKLRVFDIRFRLILGLKVAFDTSISYTKNETPRKIYSH